MQISRLWNKTSPSCFDEQEMKEFLAAAIDESEESFNHVKKIFMSVVRFYMGQTVKENQNLPSFFEIIDMVNEYHFQRKTFHQNPLQVWG